MQKNLVRKIRQMPIVTVREFMAIDGQKFREDMAAQNAKAKADADARDAAIRQEVAKLPEPPAVESTETK